MRVGNRSAARKAIVFGLQFIPLFAAFLWLYPRLLPSYEQLVVGIANPVMELLSPRLRFEVKPDGSLQVYELRPDGRERTRIQEGYQPHVILLSLALLPALLLATPGTPLQRLRLLLVGAGLLLLVHVVCLIGLFHGQVQLGFRPKAGFGSLRSFLATWVVVASTTSGEVGAVAIWLLLTWKKWTEGVS